MRSIVCTIGLTVEAAWLLQFNITPTIWWVCINPFIKIVSRTLWEFHNEPKYYNGWSWICKKKIFLRMVRLFSWCLSTNRYVCISIKHLISTFGRASSISWVCKLKQLIFCWHEIILTRFCNTQFCIECVAYASNLSYQILLQ